MTGIQFIVYQLIEPGLIKPNNKKVIGLYRHKKDIIKSVELGITAPILAQKYRVTPKVMRDFLKEIGQYRPFGISDEVRKSALEDIKSGMTHESIAEKYNLARNTVSHWAINLKRSARNENRKAE